ncbi:lipopolysaccharide-induced tumor necrosis factor-alpha factor homolog [Osmia lignaria lignaria]|uniref:lipopolysaccharide-induced tumor necrosis factor-alpha factor homolog n=1 Tax=Osmia lignaria lignaria TaxID=1437193 RepID=UPI0014793790|nr:lipopolysaccharide-induced tumor necrosis factor-alpha factor homolog [Osmia lignaria]
MEKNVVFAPSAPPPPSAPPSYEEAVGNASRMPVPPITPYPVGPSSMPTPGPPLTSEPTSQPLPHYNANPNPAPAPAPDVRMTYSVIYELSPNPVKMTCPTCHASIKTTTIQDHKPSAHLCCIVLCLLGCCLCSCLPYCISSFMNVHHFCPKCKNYIGTCKG